MRIDDNDKALLALLRYNARATVSHLARKLQLSRTTVQSRIERLERGGVIDGYTTRLSADYEKNMIEAHILIRCHPRKSPLVEKDILSMTSVTELYSISGEFDSICLVASHSVGEMNSIINYIGQLDGVERTVSSIILSKKLSPV